MFKFNFQFGKKKPDRRQIILISVILSAIVATLSQCTGVSQKRLWDLLDEAQRTLFPQTIINDVLIQDSNILDRRIKRDIDKAIRDYEHLTQTDNIPIVPKPKLVERPPDGSKAQELLGGEMRLCAPWLDDCLKE